MGVARSSSSYVAEKWLEANTQMNMLIAADVLPNKRNASSKHVTNGTRKHHECTRWMRRRAAGATPSVANDDMIANAHIHKKW
jgi:hypothetical protein